MYSTPLLFTSLGGVMSENSGVVNIGLEGMMTFGAFAAATAGYFTGNPWLGFMAGGMAAGFLGLLHAIACVTFAANQVVSGIAINFLGPGMALFLSRKFFDGATMTYNLPIEMKMPKYFNNILPEGTFLRQVFNQDVSVYLAFLLVFVIWFLLYRTKTGLRIRAVGEYPEAAETLGVSVSKVRYLCVILSGVFAGFGGASMSLAVASNFFQTLISGQGFIALAAMIFGKWKPHGAMAACLIFGGAQAMTIFIGGTSLRVPQEFLSMAPYILTLVILMGFVGKAVAPAADGVPYTKDES
jgi:simple sugar transport system permease protein